MSKIKTTNHTVEVGNEAVENIKKVAESDLPVAEFAQKVVEAVEDR